jgi:hypothetical protein
MYDDTCNRVTCGELALVDGTCAHNTNNSQLSVLLQLLHHCSTKRVVHKVVLVGVIREA